MSYPKPKPKAKAKKAPKRRKPLKRGKRPRVRNIYADKRWITLRNQVRKRSGGICESCGTRVATECHHRFYAAGVGARKLLVPLEMILHLCQRCHEDRHEHLRAYRT